MQNSAINTVHEHNPMIPEITKLTLKGLSDHQIGQLLGKHYKTIAYHRLKNGIASGRSHKAALSKQRRAQTMNTRSYKMNDVISMSATKIRHGLNAYSPITCKGCDCPYSGTCSIAGCKSLVGKPCIIETTTIDKLSRGYRQQFQYDDGDYVDMRVQHLIDVEIKLMRCNRLMAMNPELVYTIWKDEQPTTWLNPIARYELFLMGEYGRILKDLRTIAAV